MAQVGFVVKACQSVASSETLQAFTTSDQQPGGRWVDISEPPDLAQAIINRTQVDAEWTLVSPRTWPQDIGSSSDIV